MEAALGGATMKRILAFLKSIVFAGMKPGAQTAPKRQLAWLGPLRGPVERLLSGGPAPTDPLYLTNRTRGRKLLSWSLVGIPCLVLLAGIGITLSNLLSNLLDAPLAKPAKELTAAEITAKLLPNMDKDFKLAAASDVQVLEARVDGTRLIGKVKNTSTREIAGAELVIDLADAEGSQVGAVSTVVGKIPPSGTKDFEISIKQRNAASAMVREVTLR
jgi:hypothetical protein